MTPAPLVAEILSTFSAVFAVPFLMAGFAYMNPTAADGIPRPCFNSLVSVIK